MAGWTPVSLLSYIFLSLFMAHLSCPHGTLSFCALPVGHVKPGSGCVLHGCAAILLHAVIFVHAGVLSTGTLAPQWQQILRIWSRKWWLVDYNIAVFTAAAVC